MNPFIVLGGAACMLDDLEALGRIRDVQAATVIAVNQIPLHYPGRVDHWATLHPERLEEWVPQRVAAGESVIWAHTDSAGRAYVDRVVDHWMAGAGLFGARVAKELGASAENPAILCGCPMDDGPHFFTHEAFGDGPRTRAEYHRNELRQSWRRYAPFVRSMSGYTREKLGAPDGAGATESEGVEV